METLTKDERAAPPVEFRYDLPDNGLVAPEFFATWCVSDYAKDEIARRDIKHAHLVISFINKDDKEYRRVVKPLSEGGCFLNFDYTRANDIHAAIVWPEASEDPKEFCERIMESGSWGHAYDLKLMGRPKWGEDLDRTTDPGSREAVWKGHAGDQPVVILGLPEQAPGEDERYYYAIEGSSTRIPADEVEFSLGFDPRVRSVNRLDGETVETFNVDPKLFAKPPRELTKRFVGFFPWGRGRPEDQCDVRGQVAMSLLASPFVGFYWLFLRAPVGLISGLFLMFLGIPRVTLWPVFHPVTSGFEDIWTNRERRSRYYEKQDGSDQFYLFWLFNPVIVTVVLGTLTAFNVDHEFWPWWAVVAVGVGGPIAIMLVIGIVALIVASVPVIAKPAKAIARPFMEKRKASRQASFARKKEEAEREAVKERELIEKLACDQSPRTGRIRDVNGDARKIVSLVATQQKTKVCKRYARDAA